jgi:hypothetical protein
MTMQVDPSFGRHVSFLRDIARRVSAERVVLAALRSTAVEMSQRNPARAAAVLREISARLRRGA